MGEVEKHSDLLGRTVSSTMPVGFAGFYELIGIVSHMVR